MPPIAHNLLVDPSFRPFLDLVEAQYLTSEEVARRFRYNVQSVHNMRAAGKGPAFVKLGDGNGAVRYRISEVLAFEMFGHGGGLTMDRVAVALATCPGLKLADREKIESHLRKILCVKVAA